MGFLVTIVFPSEFKITFDSKKILFKNVVFEHDIEGVPNIVISFELPCCFNSLSSKNTSLNSFI